MRRDDQVTLIAVSPGKLRDLITVPDLSRAPVVEEGFTPGESMGA